MALSKLARTFAEDDEGTSLDVPADLGPIENWSPEMLDVAVRQGRPEAAKEQSRRAGGDVPIDDGTKRFPFVSRRPVSTWVEELPEAFAPGVPMSRQTRPLSRAAKAPNVPTGRSSGIEGPVPSYTLEEPPPETTLATFPKLGGKIAGTLVAPLASPAIQPVATASAAGAKLTDTAPKAEVATETTRGAVPPTAAPVPGAGGDADLDRLAMAQGIIQGLESFGSAVSGKNLRSGMADTLGERYRQAQALAAKRQEKSIADTEERTNLNAAIDSYKKLFPSQQDALEDMRGSTNKPAVLREALNAWRQKMEWEKGKLPVAQATVEQKLAGVKEKEALTPVKSGKLLADTELAKARTAKVYKDMALAGTRLALGERKTIEDAEKAKDPYKKLEALNTIADKKEFGGFTTLAGDLADLERTAPGFVTRGKVPDWLTREQQLLGQNWPSSTDPRVVDFLSKYSKVANEERHRQYGSAQTDGELRSFMQQLNSSPLSAGPQVLARQVKSFADAAGRVAKGRLTRYNNVFGSENTATVFAPEWKSLFDKGGVFAAHGSPFVSAGRAAASADATLTVRRKSDGKTKVVPATDKTRWLANPDFEEVP